MSIYFEIDITKFRENCTNFNVYFPLTFTYIFKIRPILGSQKWILLYLWQYANPYRPNTVKMTAKSRSIAFYENILFLLPF